jgi:2-polyprenyl-3-methyl-5-hydroxy-6-metoxy-1,4-benzoquinol methylase
MEIVHYNNCPVCESSNIQKVLTAIDQTVTKEAFDIWECSVCTLRFTQNVPDENSIAPYYQSADYISHSETKQGVVNRLYHTVRDFTLQQKFKLVRSFTKKEKGNILDIGAGTGAFLQVMRSHGWVIKGLEPDETARKNAKQIHNILLEPLKNLALLPAKAFDAISLWHVLEHVHQLKEYFVLFQQLLSDNGVLFIAVPNYTSTDATLYGRDWAAYDVPRHLYHFSPKSMEVLTKKYGFRIEKMKPMWFDSFYVSMLSEQHQKGSKQFTFCGMERVFNLTSMHSEM